MYACMYVHIYIYLHTYDIDIYLKGFEGNGWG